jgi:hypothetical protein
MVLGLVGLVVCLVPVLGLAVSIVGIALGSIGLKSERHGHATAGLVLSILDLIGSIAWAVIGGLASLGAFL